MTETAAKCGIPEAVSFMRMTPREIHLAVACRKALARQRRDRALLLARCMALAVHDPSRLPPPPPEDMPDMTDEQMKQRLLAWRRKESP